MLGGGLESEKEKVKAAGRGFLEYLKRNGFNAGKIRQVGVMFDMTMMYVTRVLTESDQPPRQENQVVSHTDGGFGAQPGRTNLNDKIIRDDKGGVGCGSYNGTRSKKRVADSTKIDNVCRVSFNDTVTIIPIFGIDGMGMGVGEEGKADETDAVFQRSKRLRLSRSTNVVAVTTTAESDYEKLERDFREKIISWTTGAKSFSITITEDHKKDIADYVSSNWIQARRFISIEILKNVEIWEPLVEAVFSQESREEKKKLVEFFRKSVAQPKNRLKPILRMLV